MRATYVPKRGQHVSNLLSLGIVSATPRKIFAPFGILFGCEPATTTRSLTANEPQT